MMSVKRFGTLVAVLLVAIALCWPAAASAVQLTIDADTFVNSGSINQNNGTATSLKVSSSLTTYLKFDLTALPAGTTAADIDKATVTFYVNTVTTQGPFNITHPRRQRLGRDQPHLRQQTGPRQSVADDPPVVLQRQEQLRHRRHHRHRQVCG